MRGSTNSKGITRRTFLKGAGLGFAVNTLAPVIGIVNSVSSLRVAVIVPESRHFPPLGDHFMDGLKTYAAVSGQRLNTTLYRTPPGVAAFRKMLHENTADVVIAYASPLAAQWIGSALDHGQTTLLMVDPGSQVTSQADDNPFVTYHTLNLWQSNWAMASHAVSQYGQRAMIATSQYESGFSAFAAAQMGVEMSGGQIIDTVITHMQPENSGIDSLLSAIRATRPDFVFAAYSGSQAVDFLRAYRDSGLNREIPLVASAYTVDEAVLAQVGNAALGIQSAFSWASTNSDQPNVDFLNAYRAQTARPADSLALLGYDTAHLLDHAVRMAPGQRGAALAQAISTLQIDSPRGIVSSSTQAGVLGSSVVLREVQQINGRAQQVMTGQFDAIPEQEVQSSIAATARTGWLNAYLS
ncbi:MAG: ABC transporter substrate-binding protein [Anaerolineae bacterium]